jgi:CTP:molybdopterin cytidylyltransferase MocA
MDAIVTAGGISKPDDPLYGVTGVDKKALIPLVGKPMVNWVLEALTGSGFIDNIVLVGLSSEEVKFPNTSSIHFVESVGGMIDNILVAVDRVKQINPTVRKVLLCSSDIPLITPETLRGFIEECGTQEADVYYAAVEKKTMETRFPNSKRMFVPFKGGRYSGGDLILANSDAPDRVDLDFFRALTGLRKNYWEQVRLLGFGFILRFLLRRMTVEEAAKRASQIIKIDARVVETRFAEVGMDLDKPHQYEIIKSILEKRHAQTLRSQ